MAKKKRELTEVERAERVLAEMLNEAGKRGLKFLSGSYADNYYNPTACCALGALALARGQRPGAINTVHIGYNGIVNGNDHDEVAYAKDEKGPSLGFAIGRSYRDALQ